MNMPINLTVARIQAKVHELALALSSELGIEEDDLSILIEDSEIYATLEKKAQVVIEEADECRKREVLMAAKKKLGIYIEPKKVSKTVTPTIIQQLVESAWHKYLKEGNYSLSDSLTQLETSEEVSAARGFLIGVLTRHRRNSDWVKDELKEAVDVWHKRVQVFLDVINNFFGKKEDIPTSSGEVYSRVSNLLEGDRDIQWYMNGPAGIQAELEAKRKEQEFAQQKAIERQQRKEILEAKKREITELLVAGNVLSEDAEKLASATIKKFPDLRIKDAMIKMAVNRQVAAIQKSRDFLGKVATDAKPYLSGVGKSEKEFLLEVGQHSEVASLLKRDATDLRIPRR